MVVEGAMGLRGTERRPCCNEVFSIYYEDLGIYPNGMGDHKII